VDPVPLGFCKTDAYKRQRVVLTKNTVVSLFLPFAVSSRMASLTKHIAVSINLEGTDMNTNAMVAEIRDANLGYLMLAQQMVRADKATAVFRLGISNEIADLIDSLNNAQILKLAGANMMLARFRFDDGTILSMLTNNNKERGLAQSHAAILMSNQAAEEIA
jgi:flagellar transcriptional activator FlhD